MNSSGEKKSKGYSFGTFKGVFLPSVLTILGVVMYLRFGWVLGNLGLPGTFLVVTLASSVTFVTGLSLAALATNMRVGGGGAYYILSRSLGVEAGAAVGVPLYLAQTFGIAFYIAGFTESLCSVFPSFSPVVVGIVTLVVLATLAYVSADLALRAQFVVLLCILASLISFVAGSDVPTHELHGPQSPGLSFWAVFAVFFPAVTGIEAGIAMSGDLKKPERSLPLGTLAAVVTGYMIYLMIPVLLYYRVPDRGVLLNDPMIMQQVARWGNAILVGVWAASLSSALGAMLGSPRTLQALARDRVVPRFIGRGFGRGGDPRIAAAISFAIAFFAVVFGSLNAIAPLLTMFFLTSYGLLNLSAGIEELMGHPAWRPRFRIPAWVGLAGFVGCASVMFMINAGATVLAATFSGGLYWWMKRRKLRARWGDLRLGFLMHGAREMLYRLAGRTVDPRNWAPNIIVFSGPPAQRWYLIELADAMARRGGFMTVVNLVRSASWTAERGAKATETIHAYLKKKDIRAFVRVTAVQDPMLGAREFIRNYGFGPLKPNMIMIGETEKAEKFESFVEVIGEACRMRRNFVVLREPAKSSPVESDGRIDIWWGGDPGNVGLMLALAHLLRRTEEWDDSKLMIKTVVKNKTECEKANNRLEKFIKDARLGRSVEHDVLVSGERNPFEVICESSSNAELVFLGMRAPEENEQASAYAEYYRNILDHTEKLPTTALVIAAGHVSLDTLFADDA